MSRAENSSRSPRLTQHFGQSGWVRSHGPKRPPKQIRPPQPPPSPWPRLPKTGTIAKAPSLSVNQGRPHHGTSQYPDGHQGQHQAEWRNMRAANGRQARRDTTKSRSAGRLSGSFVTAARWAIGRATSTASQPTASRSGTLVGRLRPAGWPAGQDRRNTKDGGRQQKTIPKKTGSGGAKNRSTVGARCRPAAQSTMPRQTAPRLRLQTEKQPPRLQWPMQRPRSWPLRSQHPRTPKGQRRGALRPAPTTRRRESCQDHGQGSNRETQVSSIFSALR